VPRSVLVGIIKPDGVLPPEPFFIIVKSKLTTLNIAHKFDSVVQSHVGLGRVCSGCRRRTNADGCRPPPRLPMPIFETPAGRRAASLGSCEPVRSASGPGRAIGGPLPPSQSGAIARCPRPASQVAGEASGATEEEGRDQPGLILLRSIRNWRRARWGGLGAHTRPRSAFGILANPSHAAAVFLE
jgi:hypothetical protein